MKYGNYDINEQSDTSVAKVIGLIEPNSKVIEFGSSHGYILKYLKDKKNCTVYGYDIDKEAVALANKNGVKTKYADLDDIDKTLFYTLDKDLDYIICADVLEHLKNIEFFLGLLSNYMQSNQKCKLIVSFPNITYYGVIYELLHAKFKYRPLGILDNTHLKFYDKEELEKLFNLYKFEVKFIQSVIVEPKVSEFDIELNKKIIDILESFNNKEYMTYQYVFMLEYSEIPKQTIKYEKNNSVLDTYNDFKNKEIQNLKYEIDKREKDLQETLKITHKKDKQIIELNQLTLQYEKQNKKINQEVFELKQVYLKNNMTFKNFIKYNINYYLVKFSKYYDNNFYAKKYFDNNVEINYINHYLDIGWKLGYNPSEFFDTNLYLILHKDVKNAGINPLIHYLRHGRFEKRSIDKNGTTSLLRKIYKRFYILQFIRNNSKRVIQNIKENIFTSSSQNLQALQNLSQRRDKVIAKILKNEDKNSEIIEIDISIVVYNSEKWISKFFDSLIKQNYPLNKLNLYFIDHSPNDTTCKLLEDQKKIHKDSFQSFNIIKQENLGFGHGHNRAIKESKSDFILVSNIDIEFEIDSISNIVKNTQKDREKEYASWEFRQIPYEHPKYYDPITQETNWSSHACILIRREAYNQVGGYEPKIFMYAEDVELSYRFRAYGWHLKYCPDSIVYHYTYEEANEIKPLQFQGSTLGNAYLRLRYGNKTDKFAIPFLYIALLLQKERFKGSRKIILSNISKLIKDFRHFNNHKQTSDKFYAPFRGFDYEFIRDGAFYDIKLPPQDKLVSIVVRTYKQREQFLRQCLVSILNQTYKNLEVIVVEDGGDTMKSLVSEFSAILDIKYYPLQKIGRSATGNYALDKSTGDYCVFLDDDDFYFNDHVETLIQPLLKDANLSATYTLAFEIPTDRIDNSKYIESFYKIQAVFYQEFDYEILKDHNYFPIQSILFKKDIYLQRGGFDESLTYLEDWNLWLRYAYNNNFKYIEKTTSAYRIPFKQDISNDRQKLLDDAYIEAKQKAFKSIEDLKL